MLAPAMHVLACLLAWSLQEPATHGFFTLGSQAFSPHLLHLEGLLFRTQESRGL